MTVLKIDVKLVRLILKLKINDSNPGENPHSPQNWYNTDLTIKCRILHFVQFAPLLYDRH